MKRFGINGKEIRRIHGLFEQKGNPLVEIPLEIISTPEEAEIGLKGRDSLKGGALFMLPIPFIWMQDTKIPLEILALAPQEEPGLYEIVEIHAGEPFSEEEIDTQGLHVLEVNAGFCSKWGISPGVQLRLIL